MLATRELTFRVGEHALWTDLDLELGAGERVAVIGPSGSGKTTLLRAHRDKHYSPEGALVCLDALGRGRDFLTRRTDQLSGGETQIVAVVARLARGSRRLAAG